MSFSVVPMTWKKLMVRTPDRLRALGPDDHSALPAEVLTEYTVQVYMHKTV